MKRVHVAMAVLICLAGCKSKQGPSESSQTSIVKQVKDAGVKEAYLRKADVAGLQVWLMQHADVEEHCRTVQVCYED
jgi:hypothetical protein